MKSFTKILSIVLIPLLLATTMMSCVTTKTDVGTYASSTGEAYTYAKGKQIWLFWGLVPIGRTKVNTPADGSCQVVTRFNIVDGIVTSLTGGLITTYTIKVKAKK